MKNPGLVEVFKEARRRIESGDKTYICLAIKYGYCHYDKCQEALELISIRMGNLQRQDPGYSLEQWLTENSPGPDYYSEKLRPPTRKYRVRWLDSLIAEFS